MLTTSSGARTHVGTFPRATSHSGSASVSTVSARLNTAAMPSAAVNRRSDTSPRSPDRPAFPAGAAPTAASGPAPRARPGGSARKPTRADTA
nr:hypothetical protein [Streptomyces bambusae]